VVEFGILPGVKYQRYTAKLDTSDDNLESMSKSWLPEFRQQQVFLKVLVEGKASLYIYRTREWTRFFFRINDTTPEPLIFKRYSKNDGTISENFSYVSQIRDSLSCASMQLDNAPAFSYEARALSRLFIAYNTCSNACYTDYRAKDAKTLFHLNIRPGLNLSDLVVKENANNGSSGDTHYPYGQKLSVRIGAEAEFVLNFGKNKWAIIFEPAYQYYKVNSTGLQSGYLFRQQTGAILTVEDILGELFRRGQKEVISCSDSRE